MRDGRTIGTYPMSELTVREIAEMMVGGEPQRRERRARRLPTARTLLELDSLGLTGEFHDVTCRSVAGEIVALYGLVGSGVSEIADAVYGIEHATSGEIRVAGQGGPAQVAAAGAEARHRPPARRTASSRACSRSRPSRSTSRSAHLPAMSKLRVWMDRRRERSVSRDLIKRLSVKTPSERQTIGAMSGGNAQKVVLARQLVSRPDVLVLAEPTQGVDVGAKEEIHRIIRDLAGEGTAVLVVTSDLAEALRIADRLIVVRNGTTTDEFGPDATQVDVLASAAGGCTPKTPTHRQGGQRVSTSTDTPPPRAPSTRPGGPATASSHQRCPARRSS